MTLHHPARTPSSWLNTRTRPQSQSLSLLPLLSLLAVILLCASVPAAADLTCSWTTCTSCARDQECMWCATGSSSSSPGVCRVFGSSANCPSGYDYTTGASYNCSSAHLTGGAIAGAVIGSIVFCLCVMGALWMCRRRRYRLQQQPVIVMSVPQQQIGQLQQPMYMQQQPMQPMQQQQQQGVVMMQQQPQQMQYVQQQPIAYAQPAVYGSQQPQLPYASQPMQMPPPQQQQWVQQPPPMYQPPPPQYAQ